MSIEFRPISGITGAEVTGIDLSRELTSAEQQQLRDAWYRYGVLIFPGQTLDEAQQLRVGTVFGEISDEGEYGKQNYVSNVVPKGLTPYGELAFHCDHSWSDRPLRGLMLYGVQVPELGGETRFADVKRAWDLLPDEVRARIKDLQVVHSYPDQTKNVPIPGPDPRPGMGTSTHPIAYPHPVTGETLLFCSPRHFDHIVGWGLAESVALAQELARYIDRPEVIYEHRWRVGDVVLWDNLRLQHARNDFDRSARRTLRRTQIGEPVPVAV